MTVSAQDAHPYPIYNARFRLIVPLLDADGDPISPSAPDTELSQDLGTFADATNEATEIATSSGVVYVDLIATEMDTKSTTVRVQSTGAKTTIAVLNPRRLPVLRTGTAQAGAASTITLDSGASAVDDFYNGCWVNITNDSPANVRGQCRMITDYVGSTKVATVEGTWGTNPSSASTFEVLVSEWALLLDPVRGVGSPTAIPNAAAEAAGGLYTRGSGAGQINQNANGQVDTRTVAMAADVVTAAAIANGAIDAATFAAGAIDAAAIATDAIGAAELADGAITAATFAAGAIDAAAIANDAIDATAIAASAITSAKFAAGAIDAAAIANGAIDAATFAAGAIDAAALAQDAADKIVKAVSGTADSGSTTTIVDAERTEADTDYWAGSIVLMTSGPAVGQVRRISAFNAATDTITVASAFTQAVAVGNTYIILRTSALEAPGAGATDWTAGEKNQIRDALGVDGSKTAATGGQLQVIDDFIDTEVAAIKAKTDQLTFTNANKVDSSLQSAADIVAAVANKIADHILRRTYANARASSDGDALNFRSLLGAIGKLVNKWAISGATLTVYQEDDLTATAPGGTQAITATPGADPITTLDTT